LANATQLYLEYNGGMSEPSFSILPAMPPDTLNAVGVLKRREIEARVLGPFVAALSEKFERAHVIEILRETIVKLAQQQGAQLADEMGSNSLDYFADSLQYWTQDNALEIEVLEKTAERFDFNVIRCRYAEMYRALGLAELGAVLSCNRAAALIQGFNPDVTLTREQTIMQGGGFCPFRYLRS
jgi:L-2-amino-thiazoline-4-carboxylic acid hydrolase